MYDSSPQLDSANSANVVIVSHDSFLPSVTPFRSSVIWFRFVSLSSLSEDSVSKSILVFATYVSVSALFFVSGCQGQGSLNSSLPQESREAQESNSASAVEDAGVAADESKQEDQVDLASKQLFQQRVKPVLAKYCMECHAPDEIENKGFLTAESKDDVVKMRDVYVAVAKLMKNRSMPPKKSLQPSDEDRQFVVDWIEKTLEVMPEFRFGTENLLPQLQGNPLESAEQLSEYVVEIYEDKRGHLWFGTMNRGAIRFDGKSIKYLTMNEGLPSNAATSFAEDGEGNTWIGTQEGICKFDGKTITRFGKEDGLKFLTGSVFPEGGGNVYADREGNIWANMHSGVFRFDGTSFEEFKLPIKKETIRSHGVIPGRASLMLEDSAGNLWFGTDGYGAFRFDGESMTRFTKEDGLWSNNVNEIIEDGDGILWFACMQSHTPRKTGDGGVCRFDGEKFTKLSDVKGLGGNDIYTLLEDRAGNIWIGATGYGVYRYDGEEFVVWEKTDRMDLTWSLGLQSALEDENGTLWLGFSGGLFRFDGKSIVNVTKQDLQKGVPATLPSADKK